jgi:hypothetical protein
VCAAIQDAALQLNGKAAAIANWNRAFSGLFYFILFIYTINQNP